jgi:hypothetical protein
MLLLTPLVTFDVSGETGVDRFSTNVVLVSRGLLLGELVRMGDSCGLLMGEKRSIYVGKSKPVPLMSV